MANAPICPSCGSIRRYDAPGGMCPACLTQAVAVEVPVRRESGVSTRDKAGAGPSVARSSLPVSSAGVLDTLAVSFGSVPHVLLRDTDGGPEPPLHRPAGSNHPWPDTRYPIDGEIARGGMGAVLKGRDPDLGREVALQVLREDLQDDADMVRRFVEEAQIGGQLQHPGIVPIYELGTFGDSRPFFSMKRVKGHTLAGMLEVRPNPSGDLPRFLAVFESIAQTMACAHARGVIHRDLKPSNVMVGSFGEVQVMDWGLAKVLPRGGVVDDAHAGKTNRPSRHLSPDLRDLPRPSVSSRHWPARSVKCRSWTEAWPRLCRGAESSTTPGPARQMNRWSSPTGTGCDWGWCV
jgi:eukaryotic-like serine/threonine-protein kinase